MNKLALKNCFADADDSILFKAFEEFLEHEETGDLKSGIIKNLTYQIKQFQIISIAINFVEMELLKEMAMRYYEYK